MLRRTRSYVGSARNRNVPSHAAKVAQRSVTSLAERSAFSLAQRSARLLPQHRTFLLALVCTAVSFGAATLDAQVRADSARTDSTRRPGAPVVDSAAQRKALARRDSIVAFIKADTIKSPLARFETPKSFEVEDRLRFTRDQILSSEALSLVDLLDRVPGVTSYRTGWLASAQLAAYRGDFSKVRVFIDGVELDANDPRSNGIPDFTDVPLWTLDEIVIERSASEVRVWCRTATQNRTTPYTRTDIFTGDLKTNGFRALFGRRFRDGLALQFSGQQLATQQGRVTAFGGTPASGKGDGANSTLTARLGWARKKLSADVYAVVITRDRDDQAGRDSTPAIAAFRGSRREAYARFGYGDTTGGFWGQVILSTLRTRLDGIRSAAETDTTVHSDTTRSREQKILAFGYSTRDVQLSFIERLRTFSGKAWHSPTARASYSRGIMSGGVFLERQALDSSKHIDAAIRIAPNDRSAISFSNTTRGFDKEVERKNETVTQAQAALRLGTTWFSGGVIQQSASEQKAPTLLVGNVTTVSSLKSTGFMFGAHGGIYKDLRFDVQGVNWRDGKVYRPQFSLRSDVGLTSNWLSHFPKGQFTVNAHLIHELRDPVTFLYPGKDALSPRAVASERAQITTFLLELRIQRAVIFYHFHNVSGQPYEYVPGIVMPRQVQYYGMRWEFWN